MDDNIRKSYAMGKRKYILRQALMYAAILVVAIGFSKIIGGKAFHIEPGVPHRLVIHGEFLIGLAVNAGLGALTGWFIANRSWKRIESQYQEIEMVESFALKDE